MHGQIEKALGVVADLQARAPLLNVVNKKAWPGLSKLDLARAEVNNEVAVEFAKDGTPAFSPEAADDENADSFVFFVAWLQSQQADFDFTKGASRINGAGSRSDALEILDTLLQESEFDFHAAREAIFIIVSLHGHLGVATTFLERIQKTARKAAAHRDPRAYQTTENGKPLTVEEEMQAYAFKERAFRMIRNAVKKSTGRQVLRPSDWLPYWGLISAWREGEPKLLELRALLAVELGEDRQTPAGVFVPNAAQTYLYGGRRSQHLQ